MPVRLSRFRVMTTRMSWNGKNSWTSFSKGIVETGVLSWNIRAMTMLFTRLAAVWDTVRKVVSATS